MHIYYRYGTVVYHSISYKPMFLGEPSREDGLDVFRLICQSAKGVDLKAQSSSIYLIIYMSIEWKQRVA